MPSGFLLDAGISPKVAACLRDREYETIHINDFEMIGVSDDDVLAEARNRNCIVITTDKDLANQVAVGGDQSPSVITLRLDNPSGDEQAAAVASLLETLPATELTGILVTLERHRYRARRLPVR